MRMLVLDFLSTPSLGITLQTAGRLSIRGHTFNSLSRDHAIIMRMLASMRMSCCLSTPSLGITHIIYPLIVEGADTFNSLSRDHIE